MLFKYIIKLTLAITIPFYITFIALIAINKVFIISFSNINKDII
jgi:hypothetical protein